MSVMTAKDLLMKLLDHQYLWTNPHSVHSKPATVRRQQIEALLKALGLSNTCVNPSVSLEHATHRRKDNFLSSIEYLTRGEFLTDRSSLHDRWLSEKAATVIRLLAPTIAHDII